MQFEDLIKIMNKTGCYTQEDYKRVATAFSFAEHLHHKGKPRKSGEPYITHPVAVACLLASVHTDVDTICAGLLHDTVEDIPGITDTIIAEQFGPTIASLVDGVTKIKLNENDDVSYNLDANLVKIVGSIIKDIRIILIKLADRLHNMQTMQYMKPQKQIIKAEETQALYVPIAGLIGEYGIKTELEDNAFKYIDPESYNDMLKIAKQVEIDKQHSKDIVLTTTTKILLDQGIMPQFEARVKNVYGIYRRLAKYKSIDKVHDLIAIKVMLEDIKELYKIRDELLELFDEVEGKSKDYIVSPKTNGYRALHSTIRTKDKTMLQLQFVTPNMDKINTRGITAAYQELRQNGENDIQNLQERVASMPFYKTLEFFGKSKLSTREYAKAIKHDVLTKMIYVEDKDKNVIELPYGSTPIDFAIEHDMEDIRNIWKIIVNGEVVDPSYKLESKDSVKIVRSINDEDAIPIQVIAAHATNYKSKLKLKGMSLH